MKTLHAGNAVDFEARPVESPEGLTLTFEGRAEATAKEGLAPFLSLVDARLRQLSSKQVQVDFRKLSFMNSSCFKDFVFWLSEVRKRPGAEQYRLRFLSNNRVR